MPAAAPVATGAGVVHQVEHALQHRTSGFLRYADLGLRNGAPQEQQGKQEQPHVASITMRP